MTRRGLLGTIVLVLAAGTSGHGARAEDARAREGAVIASTLARFPGAERGTLTPIVADALARAFPEYAFYALRFPQYPVATVPPRPLRASNLLVVGPRDTATVVADPRTLETFFRAALPPALTDALAGDVARAWLRLSAELAQDGFLHFSFPDSALAVATAADGARRVTGKAVVVPEAGNRGEIDATLTFDAHGVLLSASTTPRIARGIRPLCQATKLLDPDPVVRRMAEQDLLVMGEAAKPYLDEQRAAASPALRAAIDRVWRRILAERAAGGD